MARQIEKVKVSAQELGKMASVIKATVNCFNPETGQEDAYHYTNDGVNGYIVQSNNIVLHRADGSLKMWHV